MSDKTLIKPAYIYRWVEVLLVEHHSIVRDVINMKLFTPIVLRMHKLIGVWRDGKMSIDAGIAPNASMKVRAALTLRLLRDIMTDFGPCQACGYQVVYYPPLCEKCWVGYWEAA